MPVLFIGHGSPENALGKNEFNIIWGKIAREIPKPELILCISAHWMTRGATAVSSAKTLKTIHDFYGFPKELYRLNYDVQGSPKQAAEIAGLIKSDQAELDNQWGIDHGAWVVLMNMYPEKTIPVLQLSLNLDLPLHKCFAIGEELSGLREQGVLILGSGNLVHNLMMFNPEEEPFPWAVEFDGFVKNKLNEKDYRALIDYRKQKTAAISHPTDDHYRPFIYAIGAAKGETPRFFTEKIVFGSVGMRGAIFS